MHKRKPNEQVRLQAGPKGNELHTEVMMNQSLWWTDPRSPNPCPAYNSCSTAT